MLVLWFDKAMAVVKVRENAIRTGLSMRIDGRNSYLAGVQCEKRWTWRGMDLAGDFYNFRILIFQPARAAGGRAGGFRGRPVKKRLITDGQTTNNRRLLPVFLFLIATSSTATKGTQLGPTHRVPRCVQPNFFQWLQPRQLSRSVPKRFPQRCQP